jgi:hypothetical protein
MIRALLAAMAVGMSVAFGAADEFDNALYAIIAAGMLSTSALLYGWDK